MWGEVREGVEEIGEGWFDAVVGVVGGGVAAEGEGGFECGFVGFEDGEGG